MSLSRWKMMAGVLGVSLGGLAAASQCPKNETKNASRQADPPALELPGLPTVPPAGSASPKTPPAAPSTPAVTPPVGELPALPPAPTKPPESVPPVRLPAGPTAPMTSPAMPPASPLIPIGGASEPKAVPPLSGTPGSTPPATPATDPLVKPKAPPAFPDTPPLPSGGSAGSPPAIGLPGDPVIDTPKPETKPAPIVPDGGTNSMEAKRAKPTAAKFRILLQVGEGEPKFEVKHGDDLVLKVVCDKVDIKSPEKGTGLSDVTASGNVRFVGFGAEGICDRLSFKAGTGEVLMSGNVKIAVKDKLGRVESELTTANVTYKVDPSATVGTLRP